MLCNKKLFLIICTLVIHVRVISQTKIKHYITPLSANYKTKEFDEQGYRLQLTNKYRSYFDKAKTLENFVDILTEDKKECLNIPDYDDWKEATVFVDQVARKVIP